LRIESARKQAEECQSPGRLLKTAALQLYFRLLWDRGPTDLRPQRQPETSNVSNQDCRNARLRNHGAATLALAAATVIAACGSHSPNSSGSLGASRSNPSQAQAQEEGLSFARCMRSHRISSFPDPTPNGGGFTLGAPGTNSSSPAFKAAQTACQHLMPVKHVVSQPPTPQAYARLLHWAKCMRQHGISGLPDPKPDPPPAPGSPGTAGIGTLMGDGGYWVGIPATVDAHSPTFVRLSTACGESPGGHKP
jgi:hypothetical protein